MKVVGIIGYKNSGKTMLTRALARELTRRGYEVSVVKHLSHHVDLPEKDTTILGEAVSKVGFISPQGSGLSWKKPLGLENIISHLEADIIIVEGFKAEKTFPKIVCLRGESDDQDLFDGLAICAVGPANQVEEMSIPSFNRTGSVEALRIPLLDRDEVGQIADIVEQRAFKLPNLNCGDCGHERCYDMAREIVAGTGSVEDCLSLQPATEVKIDGRPLPMNSFISSIVRNTILGMLSPLKGFKKGKIEISL
ncbi:MAG: molybdopterin-guanine dinucleotide biosynthesis protein B [Chloroflexota bacterium]|nr:molybdopterin-guanine dinucleotide biosynthesis protein B [Chloroflexota bacterium]